jgi:thiopurine S-methyltransferase
MNELMKMTDNNSSETETETESDSDNSSHEPGAVSYPVGSRGRRFDACTDATQEKGSMGPDGEYLKTYGIDILLDRITAKLVKEKPDFPLQFIEEEIQKTKDALPEISNTSAGDPNFWINYWETDKVTWQAPVTSPWLNKYMHEFLGPKPKNVFIPLCGKTLDMKLLLDAGHHVVGAECSGIACVDFFSENNIKGYTREEVRTQNGKRVVRHKSTVSPIELYEGDIFDLTPEIVGPIDAVLDRAALVALPPSIIESQYLVLITTLLRPGGRMLFASVSELPFPKAPPHAYEGHQIEGILSKFFSEIDMKEVHRYRVNAGYVAEPVYMLKSKTEVPLESPSASKSQECSMELRLEDHMRSSSMSV